MSDTPRMDAAYANGIAAVERAEGTSPLEIVASGFAPVLAEAEKIERELSIARRQIGDWARKFQELKETTPPEALRSEPSEELVAEYRRGYQDGLDDRMKISPAIRAAELLEQYALSMRDPCTDTNGDFGCDDCPARGGIPECRADCEELEMVARSLRSVPSPLRQKP